MAKDTHTDPLQNKGYTGRVGVIQGTGKTLTFLLAASWSDPHASVVPIGRLLWARVVSKLDVIIFAAVDGH